MTTADTPAVTSGRDYAAPLVGFGTFVAFLLVIEAVIRIGWLNRFIVPPPSEIIASLVTCLRKSILSIASFSRRANASSPVSWSRYAGLPLAW